MLPIPSIISKDHSWAVKTNNAKTKKLKEIAIHIPKKEEALPHCLVFPHHHMCLNVAWSMRTTHFLLLSILYNFNKINRLLSIPKFGHDTENTNYLLAVQCTVSQRGGFYSVFKNCLQELMFFHFAVDHSKYSCRGTVHLPDIQ